jgi:hypothetical protein
VSDRLIGPGGGFAYHFNRPPRTNASHAIIATGSDRPARP